MGKLIHSYVFPHPPILLPEIGMGKEMEAENTLAAMEACADEINSLKPDTIIITTPHGPIFSDYVFMSESYNLTGSFENFGHGELSFSFENNMEFIDRIKASASEMDFMCGDLDEEQYNSFRVKKGLDHGALVPLYFILKKYRNFKLVHISVADFSNIDLYAFGTCIQEAILKATGNFIFIASGDLSHKYSKESPYGFSPKGPEFDQLLMSYFVNNDILGILNMKASICQEAAECGMKSFIMMLGANNKTNLIIDVLSHEGPFGIGYGVVSLRPGEQTENRDFLSKIKAAYDQRVKVAQATKDPYVQLAQLALKYYLLHRQPLSLEDDFFKDVLPSELLKKKAGVFVSIKKHGQLRGCIGTISAVKNSIAEEIIYNAISAGTKDHRFNPITLSEFEELIFSVDILSDAESISDSSSLDVERYGVIVEAGSRRGLLLPNLEGVDTIDQQIDIALSKAGISRDEPYSMERFEVVRHK